MHGGAGAGGGSLAAMSTPQPSPSAILEKLREALGDLEALIQAHPPAALLPDYERIADRLRICIAELEPRVRQAP